MNNTQTWEQYPLISKELKQVNKRIQQVIATPHLELQNALQEMANNGGKYLRPSLLILSAKIAGKVDERIINLASSIEILHMATLIHDDIIDDAEERRGKISIQARFGKDIAVYAGDLLFTKFFNLMLDTKLEHEYLVKNSRAMQQILDGELKQMADRFDVNQTFDNYLENIKGKTAALLKLAAEEGAHFGGHNEQITKALATFGENLGIAFQMVDDILDYTGGHTLNKPILEDVATGVYSLPLLLALNDPVSKAKLVPLLNKKLDMDNEDVKQVQEIILSSSAIDKSREIAKKYTYNALDQLNSLPNSPANSLLKKLTKQLLNRTK